ncbi:D-3-phosphoglycerate dehydrogenase-like [Panicum miliaceum]|uniref:D-3-phosphoglycerate dehydrogenase-like n=1 Tax=Panicum miliaceum TaxID=4540 RepID=A0A3L6RFH6_PANMI|nr:D-3-phosphoglycerate dehydrogenase-like [Panicum miliaceum]
MKIIMQNGVGLEGVDIGVATEHKIKVARIPGCTTGNAVACAEMAIYLTLGVLLWQNHLN